MNDDIQNGLNRRRKQQGLVTVWFALSLTILMTMAALAVDVSYWYARQAETQKAADAAALAGAYKITQDLLAGANDTTISADVQSYAKQYATYNGYTSDGATTVTVTWPYNSNRTQVHVDISRPEHLFFSGISGRITQNVAASSTAGYVSDSIPIAPHPGTIESGNFDYNYSLFGPTGAYTNGDPYSTTYFADGHTINTDRTNFASTGKPFPGYNFNFAVPSNYSNGNSSGNSHLVSVQLFDPFCTSQTWTTTTGTANFTVDELRAVNSSSATGATTSDLTTTVFTLNAIEPNANGTSTTVPIASNTYSPTNGYDSTSNTYGNVFVNNPITHTTVTKSTVGQWVAPSNFTYDPTSYPAGTIFQVKAEATSGSSENGFDIRVGKPLPNSAWNPIVSQNSGYTFDPTSSSSVPIGSDGHVAINFNSGTALSPSFATIDFGTIDQTAAGGSITIHYFDTDVGTDSDSIHLICVGNSNIQSQVQESYSLTSDGHGNPIGIVCPCRGAGEQGLWNQQTIHLKPNYTGGHWEVIYKASKSDTSTWYMDATVPTGHIELVGSNGRLD